MLSCHTWPQWRGPSVDGVTYLVREVPIGPGEYAFGRTKIFIRSAKTVSLKWDTCAMRPSLSLCGHLKLVLSGFKFFAQRKVLFPCDLGSFYKYNDGFDMHGIPQTSREHTRDFCDRLFTCMYMYWKRYCSTAYCRTGDPKST